MGNFRSRLSKRSNQKEQNAASAHEKIESILPQADGKLYLFYGLLNMSNLASWLPFAGPLEQASEAEKMEYLKTKAVSLTCPGFSRVFASRHASIQENEDGKICTFGVYLTPEQERVCDQVESLGVYYDKVAVPVIVHR